MVSFGLDGSLVRFRWFGVVLFILTRFSQTYFDCLFGSLVWFWFGYDFLDSL